jgi:hypothetical protein
LAGCSVFCLHMVLFLVKWAVLYLFSGFSGCGLFCF